MGRNGGWLDWRHVLPWSVGLLGLFAAAHFILACAIEREVIRSGERRVGAQVEVGNTRVNLLGSRVSLCDLRVANPQSPLRNLVEADRCDFRFDPSALLHKHAVVSQGAVTGLRFGTPRDVSGALSGVDGDGDSTVDGWLDKAATKQAQEWLERLHHRFDRNLVERLESIRLADELLARWPEQSVALEGRVTEVRDRTSEFHSRIRAAQENPLRHVAFLDKLPKEIAAIREQVTALGDVVENLPSIAQDDRRAIVAAREHDEQLLRDELQLEPIDANILSAYLLQKQLSGPLGDLLGWLRLVRRVVPANAEPADSTPLAAHHHRGRDVLFTGCRPTPDFLIRTLQLQGTARIGGQPIELTGTLSDVTDKPTQHDQPIRLRITTHGSLPLELAATIDRTGPVARDQLLVDCGGIVLPKLRLGRSEKLRLSLAPTTASLHVSITLEGDKLSGDVQLLQRQVQITPTVGDELSRRNFDSEFQKALGEIDSLSTRVTLAGTIDRPKCEVWSNLGPTIADAMHRALVRTSAGYTRELLTESHNRVDERLADLDRQIADAQAALEPQLEDATDSLDQLAKKTTGERLSLDHLGRRLPAESLFR
jgi:uncharacterized protein (TIGR03545 family)